MNNKIVLKASAGTGKTYRMSLEYIAYISLGINYKNILVMTFTKKATSEIKERILQFTKEIIDKTDKGIDIKKNIEKLHPDLTIDITKLKAIYEEMIKDKDDLRIYTIDSFLGMIFKKAIAPYLNIYSYEMLEDEKDNQKIIEQVIKEDGLKYMKDYIEDNAEKDTDPYVDLISKLIDQRWKFYLLDQKQLDTPVKKIENIANIGEKLKSLIEDVKEICNQKNGANKKNKKDVSFESVTTKDFQKFDLGSDSANEELLKEIVIKNYKLFLNKKFWSGTSIRKSTYGDLYEEYENFCIELKKQLFNDLVIPYDSQIKGFLANIYEAYDQLKFKEKKFTFSDITNYTLMYIFKKELNFIKDNKATDDFFDVIGGPISTAFIDEFQDTSIPQWQILSKIVRSCDNLLCVGDEKQSIYAFRGGEKKLFENLSDLIQLPDVTSQKEEIITETLDTCYRSEKNIVEYSNELFCNISQNANINDLDAKTLDWRFAPVKSKSDKTIGHLDTLYATEEQNVINVVCDHILENFKDNYKGIGILARGNKDLDKFAAALEIRKIPFILESKSTFEQKPAIAALLILLKFITKSDYLAFYDFISTPFINIQQNDLYWTLNNLETIKEFFQMDEEGCKTDDIQAFEKNCKDSFETISNIKKLKKIYESQKYDTKTLVEKIITSFDFINEKSKVNDIANMEKLVELISEYRYLNDFVDDYFSDPKNNKFTSLIIPDENAVNLATVHKSKGLEYKTVYYYYKNRKQGGEKKAIEFLVSFNEKYEKINSFIFTNERYDDIIEGSDAKDYSPLITNKKITAAQEELNIHYVGITRAVNNLFVAIENKPDAKTNENDYFIKAHIQVMENFSNSDIIKEKEEKATKQNNVLQPKWSDISKNNIIEDDTKDILDPVLYNAIKDHDILSDEHKRLTGILIHFFLENLDKDISSSSIKFAKDKALSKYGSTIDPKLREKILSDKNITKIIEICNQKNIFDNWDHIFSEYEIIDKDGKSNRIDRLMVKDPKEKTKGKIYIVDFKTGSHNDEQLDRYEKLVYEHLKEKKVENNYEITSDFVEIYL